MIPIIQIISDCQNDINDLAMERIQRKEWIDIANDISMDIAEETHAYIGRYTYVHNFLYPIWQSGIIYMQNQIVLHNGAVYMANVMHESTPITNGGTPISAEPGVSNYWTLINNWKDNTPYNVGSYVIFKNAVYRAIQKHISRQTVNDPYYLEYWTAVEPAINNRNQIVLPFQINNTSISPFKIIRLIRNRNGVWKEYNEYSQQAVGRTNAGNYSFENNTSWIGENGYAVQYSNTPNSIDGSLYITFGTDLEVNETVIIDYVSNRPFGDPYINNLNTLYLYEKETSQVIPDYLRNAFKYGILTKVMERLANRGDELYIQLSEKNRMLYKEALTKVAGYTRNLNTKPYNIKIQPLNWLAE